MFDEERHDYDREQGGIAYADRQWRQEIEDKETNNLDVDNHSLIYAESETEIVL